MATFYIGTSLNDGDDSLDWQNAAYTITLGRNSENVPFNLALRFSSVNIPQGSIIVSAALKGYKDSIVGQSGTEVVRGKIYGIDEDNTADFTNDPLGRTKTTAAVDWDFVPVDANTSWTSPSIVSVVQEIVSRGGWSSGNSMGFILNDDTSDTVRVRFLSYDGDSNQDFELTVTWVAPSASPSASPSVSPSVSSSKSPSVSPSQSPSAGTSVSPSVSPSASISPSVSVSPSASPSISPSSSVSPSVSPSPEIGIKISKPGVDVQNYTNLDDLYMDSKYPLLKVHAYGTFSTLATGIVEIEHNLGYVPYVLVFSQYADFVGESVVITDEMYQHDWLTEGASVTFYGYTKIYSDKIVITVGNTNDDGTPGIIDGFYYIFKDEIT